MTFRAFTWMRLVESKAYWYIHHHAQPNQISSRLKQSLYVLNQKQKSDCEHKCTNYDRLYK